MNETEASTILKSMVAFIRSHGEERVQMIAKQADDEFTIQKENYITEEKDKIANEFKDRLKKEEINLKIEKSKKENAKRIENMRKTNELIQKLYKEARVTVVKYQKQKPDEYRNLLKNLILQGLIRLMEAEVNIRCRKSDAAIVERVMAEAADEY
jgi:V-type H+-transporting ATPase subunit E